MIFRDTTTYDDAVKARSYRNWGHCITIAAEARMTLCKLMLPSKISVQVNGCIYTF